MRFFFGGKAREVKTGVVEGLLVPFTQPTAEGVGYQGVDLYRTFFSPPPTTNYYIDDIFHTARAFYRHGEDKTLSDRLLGAAELQIREANGDDPAGVWVEEQIRMADEFDAAILQLVRENRLGFSSGVSETMYEVKPVKIGTRDLGQMVRWGIIEASLTPQPASFGTQALARELTQREFNQALRRDVALPEPDPSSGNLFLDAIKQYIPSRWDIEDLLCKVIRNVAMLAKVAAQTGSAFDYEAKVDEVMQGYAAVMAAHIKPQIADYIQTNIEETFYLRSVLIEDSSFESHTRALESGIADWLKRFSGRRETRGANRGSSSADAGRLNVFRTALQRGLADAEKIIAGADALPVDGLITDEQARELRKGTRRIV